MVIMQIGYIEWLWDIIFEIHIFIVFLEQNKTCWWETTQATRSLIQIASNQFYLLGEL